MRNRHTPPLALLALLAACGGPGSTDAPSSPTMVQGEVEYSAETLVLESFPVQLHTIVTIRNRSSSRRTVQLGSGCPVLLRAYRTEARSTAVWDQGQGLACTKQIQIVELAPGDTAQRSTRSSARDVLGDSLPNARYHLGAYVQVVGAPFVLAAGAADLGVPR